MGGLGLPELVMMAPFVFVGYIIWMALGKRQARQSQRAEVQKEIIGKFSSGAELQEFLKSDDGKALFRDLGSNGSGRFRNPRERAIARIGLGIVLIVLGTGLAVLAHQADQPQIFTAQLPPPGTAAPNAPYPVAPPSGPLLEVPPGTGLPAAVLLLTGIGLVISALVTLKITSSEIPKF